MSRGQPEFQFQCALVRHLQARGVAGVYWTALPFGEYRTKATAGRLKAMGVKPGAADLCFLKDGRAIMMELKVKPNKQSDEQIQFEADWENAGGYYYLAYTMDQALAILESLGLIKPDVSRKSTAESVRPVNQKTAA